MYCKECGCFFPGRGNTCPSCKEANPNLSTESVTSKQLNWKRFAIFLAIPLLIIIMILIFSNSGSYSIESYGIKYQKIEYRGSLSKLVNNDYELLDDFLDGNVDGKKNVVAIVCKDYELQWFPSGGGGTIDIADKNITFYESGLREYNENNYQGNYYDRFRSDFVFEIKEKRGSDAYYFQSLSDVSKWLKREF